MITIKVTDDGCFVETYTIDVDAATGQVTLARGTGGVIDFGDDRDAAKSHLLNHLQADLNKGIGFNVPVREHVTKVTEGHLATGNGRVAYWGTCSCGWKGTPWESRETAQASANGHFVFPEMVVQS
jgi:hypothetical protein